MLAFFFTKRISYKSTSSQIITAEYWCGGKMQIFREKTWKFFTHFKSSWLNEKNRNV